MRRIILCLFLLSGCGETNNHYFKQKEPGNWDLVIKNVMNEIKTLS